MTCLILSIFAFRYPSIQDYLTLISRKFFLFFNISLIYLKIGKSPSPST
ncbi:hypothetical protein BCAH1134_C0675 (plasmid) [Bacillus cereus AH1134]|nr:hypothetical protein BCAH1134_C0675 [Bacillus cereus AH1134]